MRVRSLIAAAVLISSIAYAATPAEFAAMIEHAIHEASNEARAQAKVMTLAENDQVSAIARAHSQWMADTGTLAHTQPGGRDLRTRLSSFKNLRAWGENIRYDGGRIDLEELADLTDVEALARAQWLGRFMVLDSQHGWLSSPGHRRNLLEPVFSEIGVGVAIDGDGKIYSTQDFILQY